MNFSFLSVTFQLPTDGCSGRDGFGVVIILGIVVDFGFIVVVVEFFASIMVSARARAANTIRHKYQKNFIHNTLQLVSIWVMQLGLHEIKKIS